MKNFHEAFSPANVKATMQAHGEPAMNSKIPRFKIGFASSGESRTNVPSGILDTNGAWVRYEDHIAAPQASMIPSPRVAFHVVEQLSITERGAGGFGSSGK